MNSAAISSAEFQVRSNESLPAAYRQRASAGRLRPSGAAMEAARTPTGRSCPRSAGACQSRRRGRQDAGALRGRRWTTPMPATLATEDVRAPVAVPEERPAATRLDPPRKRQCPVSGQQAPDHHLLLGWSLSTTEAVGGGRRVAVRGGSSGVASHRIIERGMGAR